MLIAMIFMGLIYVASYLLGRSRSFSKLSALLIAITLSLFAAIAQIISLGLYLENEGLLNDPMTLLQGGFFTFVFGIFISYGTLNLEIAAKPPLKSNHVNIENDLSNVRLTKNWEHINFKYLAFILLVVSLAEACIIFELYSVDTADECVLKNLNRAASNNSVSAITSICRRMYPSEDQFRFVD